MNTQHHERPRGPRSPRLRAAILIAALSLTGGLTLATVTAALPASAVDTGTLGIRPSNESDFFHLAVVAGDSVAATAIVTNHLGTPVTLSTYVVDGLTSPSGAFALSSQAATPTSVGSWSHLASGQITVAARSQLSVPFTIRIPVGTKPGDYAGGLMIQTAPVLGSTTQSNSTSVRVNVVQRQGVRIYLTVPGASKLKLTALPLSWAIDGNHVMLSQTVTNNGNTTLHPTASVLVDHWLGEKTTLHFDAPESVPPGATVTMKARYDSAPWAQMATARTVILSAAGTDSGVIDIVSLSVTSSLILATLVLLLAFALWRTIRYLRRAHRALALVAATGESRAP